MKSQVWIYRNIWFEIKKILDLTKFFRNKKDWKATLSHTIDH